MKASADFKIKIWDLRTGGIFETIQYDHAVTGLQFDTRKIVAATGENGVKVTSSHIALANAQSNNILTPDL